MADACERLIATSSEHGPDASAAERDRLSREWMQAVEWPPHYVGLQNRLHRLALARDARQKGQPLYFWHGPAIPMRTVVAGSGPYRG